MIQYIIKKKCEKEDKELIAGIKRIDKQAKFTDKLEDCDIAVMQRGWTKSKVATHEWNRAVSELHKPCREGYLYTDKYQAHTPKERLGTPIMLLDEFHALGPSKYAADVINKFEGSQRFRK